MTCLLNFAAFKAKAFYMSDLAAQKRPGYSKRVAEKSTSQYEAYNQPPRMANIIHVGTNEAVMTTRKTILEKAGHGFGDLLQPRSSCRKSA